MAAKPTTNPPARLTQGLDAEAAALDQALSMIDKPGRQLFIHLYTDTARSYYDTLVPQVGKAEAATRTLAHLDAFYDEILQREPKTISIATNEQPYPIPAFLAHLETLEKATAAEQHAPHCHHNLAQLIQYSYDIVETATAAWTQGYFLSNETEIDATYQTLNYALKRLIPVILNAVTGWYELMTYIDNHEEYSWYDPNETYPHLPPACGTPERAIWDRELQAMRDQEEEHWRKLRAALEQARQVSRARRETEALSTPAGEKKTVGSQARHKQKASA